MLVGMAVWTLMPQDTHGQCKKDPANPIKGQFSINGNKVQVNGDGGGVSTAINNIPIKICEGEIIKLKNTLAVSSLSNVNYWITPYNSYNGLSTPPSNPISAVGGYTTVSGDLEVKMITKDASNPDGFSAYATPGLYIITQYDNSSVASVPGFHHACQVIEIIAPPKPVATVSTCSGGEFQVTIPVNANNIFDDYKVIFTPLSGTEETEFTGKQTLPFSLKKSLSGNPSNSNVIINISGGTITGGCPSPPANSF
jgi:hypothetical protein